MTLELSSASVTENGGSSTVTATLSSASSQAVTLTVAAAAVDPATSSDFTVGGTTLTIAAGATESTGTVTITAVDNDVDAANKTVTVSATATGGNGVANPADATLTITDDDTRGVTVTGVSLTMDEADKAGTGDTREDQDSYTVVLDSEPTDDVRIDLAAPAMVTLSPTSLTFTPANWNVAQTVTATAVNDAIDNAGNERTGSIAHAVVEGDSDYAGVAAAAVAVTVNDDDGTPAGHPGAGPPRPSPSRRRQLDHGDRFLERRFEPGDHPDGRRRGRLSGGNGRLHPQRHDPDHRGRRHREHGHGDHHGGGQRCDAANKTVTVSATATGGNGKSRTRPMHADDHR